MIPFPEGEFDIILADPPWQYEKGTTTPKRTIEEQYITMTLDDICAMKIPAAKNSILLLWVTSPKLEEGLRVMNAWGFKYRTSAVWVKSGSGMGHWFHIDHELVLLGKKGNFPAPPDDKMVSSVFSLKKVGHSIKPFYIHNLIDLWYPDKRKLEMFARTPYVGWEVWGNEIRTPWSVPNVSR